MLKKIRKDLADSGRSWRTEQDREIANVDYLRRKFSIAGYSG